MKKIVTLTLLSVILLFLTACSGRPKDGVYEDSNGYQLVISGEDVRLNAYILSGEGKIKGNTFEVESSLLGLTSQTQVLTYKTKGNTIEVTDENGNLMIFKKTDEVVGKKSLVDLIETSSDDEDEMLEEDDETTSSSTIKQKETSTTTTQATMSVTTVTEGVSQASSGPWNAEKSAQLAHFMIEWGNSMGQPDYRKVEDGGNLFWNGSFKNKIDASYSETGLSTSEYTIVATYVYSRDINLVHRYHFALRQDGTPIIFYSENNRMFPPNGASSDYTEYFNYNVSKETENTDLKDGFSRILNQ
ncbi:DUF4767 domain-containing protein [Streptococcus caprae]|uniref:DUF4767 domain-containing protein n=1 Tax=Streptococcus caprae TaxID=1640501 RepID=A0ABV8CUU9_9STRE